MTAPQPLTMADPLWRPSTKAPRLWAITASLFWVPVIVAEIVCAVLIPGIPSWVVAPYSQSPCSSLPPTF